MRTYAQMMLSIAAPMAVMACNPAQADAEERLALPSVELAVLSGFAGDYVIVDARRASDVAAPASLPSAAADSPIGQTVSFTRDGIEMEGLGCDAWRIDPEDTTPNFIETDPNLVDLTLEPADAPKSRGDQRNYASFAVTCEDEFFAAFHRIDDRVIIWPSQNSSVNLVLEKTMPPVKIKAYQAQLKSMKLYSGELTGELDAATLAASRRWYEYRANLSDDHPVPARPAITENLLDTLRVISP